MPDSSGGGTDDKYREAFLNLGDARQETSLGVGLLEKIVAGKKEYFLKKMIQQQHLKLIPRVQL